MQVTVAEALPAAADNDSRIDDWIALEDCAGVSTLYGKSANLRICWFSPFRLPDAIQAESTSRSGRSGLIRYVVK